LPADLRNENVLGPANQRRAALGGASFLFAAYHPETPLVVDLKSSESGSEPDLPKHLMDRWNTLERGIRVKDHSPGVVTPTALTRPLTDSPFVLIEWHRAPWGRTRAFHRLLEDDAALRARLSKGILAVQKGSLTHPGILCCHILVRLQGRVLLCQRQVAGDGVGYHKGLWSLSFEEQMHPGESVEDCVRRGLAEEFLGGDGFVEPTIRVMAGVIERDILNLALLVLVDIPQTPRHLFDRWRLAADKDEHYQIAVADLQPADLEAMARNGCLPEAVRSKADPCDPEAFRATTEWALHPTSLARAAVALWTRA
jgi:hypothetical protein